jgi:flavin-dependent dehydrogenase
MSGDKFTIGLVSHGRCQKIMNLPRPARTLQPVNIAGGGVAGLALGLALRREGVPVRVHEAGVYPRHRLCGEFISGAGPDEFARLGLTHVAHEAAHLGDAAWFLDGRKIFHRPLPEPAAGISRWRLDAAMAARLAELGGEVLCHARVRTPPPGEGWVLTTGRPRADGGPWIAQKAHYQNLPTEAGLEMHLGHNGYAGLARIESGKVNVCALLPATVGRKPSATLSDRLRACGMDALAARLDAASAVESSGCGISHFRTGWQSGNDDTLSLGDHAAIIPPFTGHGLSMAMLAALEAAPELTRWSAGRVSWRDAVRSTQAALRRKFAARLRWAAWLHPWLLRPAGQAALRTLCSCGLFPWRWLYHRVR